jgi:hypothetical protein
VPLTIQTRRAVVTGAAGVGLGKRFHANSSVRLPSFVR